MLKIHSITMKNFLSVGDNPLTIQLDRSPTTLITGVNGSGKSGTVTDSIAFALFGKSYRGINKPNLVNTINKKDCWVEIVFTQNGSRYQVRRGIKPAKFEIYRDGKMLDQEGSTRDQQRYLEDTILRFSYKAFCQTCILGSANYTPFMRLSAGARREVNENLLDIGVFGTMNAILKARYNDWKDRVREAKSEYERVRQAYDMQQDFVETLKTSNDEKAQKKRQELKRLRGNTEAAQKKVDEYTEQINDINDGEDVNAHLSEAQEKAKKFDKQLTKQNVEHKTLDEKQSFFEENDECPTCFQQIDPAHRDRITEKLGQNVERVMQTIAEYEANYTHYAAQVNDLQEMLTKIRRLEDARKEQQNIVNRNTDRAMELIEEVKELEGEQNRSMGESEAKLADLKEQLARADSNYQKLIGQQDVYEVGSRLLRDDGIKSSIIRQYLPILNSAVNHYLQLLNFGVRFELDEDFNETLRSRYRDEFTYENFSQGERQRLDIAILMAWRYVAKLKNSVSTNLLIFDETFDSGMDAQGTDDLLTIIDDITREGNQNVFIVSHKNNLEDKLRSSIRFEKVNGFTQMADKA